MLAALASSPATKALDPDPFPRHSLRHAVYAALLHFGFETAAYLAVRKSEEDPRRLVHFTPLRYPGGKGKLARAAPGLRLNEHIEADGPTVFAHACRMGLEGIVSKRKNSTYRSGPSRDWLKSKNPACAAVKRESEEDWATRV